MTEQFGTLTSLETMMLLNCSITYLPNLSNLQQLRILEVPMNQLTHLDGIPGVEMLALDINVFSEIPILEKRENLRGLSMIDNRLKSFDPILLYKNLEAIFISNTSMSSIPPAFDQLRNLTYLDVGKNPLSYFPENLFNLPKLEFLNLRKTLISPNDIRSIQKTFAKSNPSIQILI
jgi:Leucine-rich repeat (LRR) protein